MELANPLRPVKKQILGNQKVEKRPEVEGIKKEVREFNDNTIGFSESKSGSGVGESNKRADSPGSALKEPSKPLVGTINENRPSRHRALGPSKTRSELEALAQELGLEVKEKKKVFVKHSYEIEESVHKDFHEIYLLLGYKNVKEAATEAMRAFVEKNRAKAKTIENL